MAFIKSLVSRNLKGEMSVKKLANPASKEAFAVVVV
jgi:hypothetical protein